MENLSSKKKTFSDVEASNEAIFSCRHCFVDIFLECSILAYIPEDRAYFVRQMDSLNLIPGRYTRVNCANCNNYVGKVVYHWDRCENKLRLTGIVPKYLFR